mgnify:CR=1 FL=1
MNNLNHNWLRRLALIVVGLAALFITRPALAQQALFLPTLSSGSIPLCRLGVNGAIRDYPIRPLRLGWYMDYQATRFPPPSPGVAYFPMIRLEQVGANSYNYSIFGNRSATSLAQLNQVIAAHPGAYWFIGNEPDRIQLQDDLEPHVYALAYRDLYRIIKDRDPTAKIVAGSIVQPTPVRLRYLDKVLQGYYELTGERMPVDVWAFHNFILNEASCNFYPESQCWGAEIPRGVNVAEGRRFTVEQNIDAEIFKQQVVAFRRWMADRGYRNTPAFLSEFGVLMPAGIFFSSLPHGPETDFFSEARVNAFMNETIRYVLNAQDPEIGYPGDNNRLIQRLAWYSVEDSILHNGYLFDLSRPPATARTGMGTNFAQLAASIPLETDFYPTRLALVGPPPVAAHGATTLTLEAVITNAGNSAVNQQATVRFYAGDPAAGGVQIGSDKIVRLQGCGTQTTVRIIWPDVAPGDYQVFVVVSSAQTEASVANNRLSTQVRFVTQQLFLPSTQGSLNVR